MADGSVPGELHQDRFERHLLAGGELLRQDRVLAAREQFEAALAKRPEDTRALGLLGLACFRMSAFEDALGVYQKLAERFPTDASYRMNLGLVHLKLGAADRAIAELLRTRELDPSQTRAVGYLGLAYARKGEYARAYEAFMKAGQAELAVEMADNLTAAERAALEPPDDADVDDLTDDAKEDGERVPAPLPAAPEQAAVQAELDQPGVITAAVRVATPSAAAAAAATRVPAGHHPPLSLSEFATARLIRPDDGDHPFEIGAGGVLIVRVRDKILSRTEGVVVSGGEFAYEAATQKVRGGITEKPFSAGGPPLFVVTGRGHLIASPLGHHFAAVTLDEDVLYLREDLVFAFEDKLRWENGHVPGSEASINVVQFRGHGCVALRTRRLPLAVKLAPDKVLYVDADALAGWLGRVVPRVVAPAGGGETSALFVECTGEGIVLLDDQGAPEPSAEPGPPGPDPA